MRWFRRLLRMHPAGDSGGQPGAMMAGRVIRRPLLAGLLLRACGLPLPTLAQAPPPLKAARIVVGMLAIGITWLLIDRILLRPVEALTIERWGLVRETKVS